MIFLTIFSKKFDIIKPIGENMLYSFDDLAVKFQDYVDIKGKIRREIQSGRLVSVVRGLYESERNISGKYLAGRIYGPSYLSFEYALSFYSLIPEAVHQTFTSATFQKRRSKKYHNDFGTFLYRDVPAKVFHLGIVLHEENGYSYQIATPEKALCDELYSLSPVRSISELKALLFEDLRLDEHEFFKLNMADLQELVPLYRSANLKFLNKLIERMS